MPDGDILDPSEIEALLKSAGTFGKPAASAAAPKPAVAVAAPSAASSGPAGDLLSSADIESLLSARSPTSGPIGTIDQAQSKLREAVAPSLPPRPRSELPNFGDAAEPFEFESFEVPPNSDEEKGLDAIREVELDLRIELGRAELLVEEVLRLRNGSVVPLDKLAGDPVDILVNGRLIARGEVLVLNDNFCVRIAEILTPSHR